METINEKTKKNEEVISGRLSEEIPDDRGSGREDTQDARRRNSLLPLIVSFLLLCLLLCASLPSVKKKVPWKERETASSEERIFVTEAEKETDAQICTQKETETEMETRAQAPDANLSFLEELFGSSLETVMAYPIRISGLTENEKSLLSFRESDFVRGLSSFLKSNNVKTSLVTFTGQTAFSGPNAAAYTADLGGIKDQKLIALFFPKFPGRYLFALENVKMEETKTAAAQTESRAQEAQEIRIEVPDTAEETQKPYDAMRLKVKGLNGEVSNYLSNPYELQYSLYDYLYKKGIQSPRKASVTDYYIDSTNRTATIQLKIDGTFNVTAIYERDQNRYSFQ